MNTQEMLITYMMNWFRGAVSSGLLNPVQCLVSKDKYIRLCAQRYFKENV